MTITIVIINPRQEMCWSVDDVMPRRDGLRIRKILKKIQLRPDNGVEKLKVDIGLCRQTIEFQPLGQRMEFSAIELSFLPLRRRLSFAGLHQRR